ncbi:hypothetical protein VE03_04507 [Pseudogymnoascus sp. 23342-1-I1]|nr:hypothetical protein VE03_04507 [Pseudogymnoascus sp. 23342-1-I1]
MALTRCSWREFTVTEGVLHTLQEASPATPLLKLPPEILIAVFNEADAIDQLALAVSCKRLLKVCCNRHPDGSTGVPLKSNAWNWRSMEPYQRVAILAQLPSSTPNAWKLCIWCEFYRPTREEYWRPKVDLHKWVVLKAKEPEMMMGATAYWKETPDAVFCPECIWSARLKGLSKLPNSYYSYPLP